MLINYVPFSSETSCVFMTLENSSSGGGNEWSAWFTNISRGEVISTRFKHLRDDRNPIGILGDCNFRARFLSYLMEQINKIKTKEKKNTPLSEGSC